MYFNKKKSLPLNSSFEKLKAYLLRSIEVSDDEFDLWSSFFTEKKIKKNQFVLREGEICKYGNFVIKGCLRMYSIDKKGEEHILQFAMEDWWISDISSMISGKPSQYNIDALEDSEVLQIDKESFEKFLSISPKFERMFNMGSQKARAALQERVTGFLSMTAEEKYLYMLKQYPNIVQRISQRHIASFLGIKPESLSRVRKNISNKSS